MHTDSHGVRTIDLQGVTLNLSRRGEGPPLLLLHGDGGPQHQLPFFARLTEHFDVIAPIHPGFAGSPIPGHFDTLEDLIYLYLDLLDALDLNDVILMGFSMGGWAAAEIAVRNTSRLARLILVDAVGVKVGDRDTRDIADVFGQPEDEITKLLYYDPSKRPNPAALTDDERTILAGNRIALALYTWEPYMHNPKLRYRLHRINRPTLLIWGANDGLVTVPYAEAYCQLIPGAKLVIIPDAGHLPQVEQPDRFIDHVLSFTQH
jgi:pimeloyl-ACP methyl ester carboxylesterase